VPEDEQATLERIRELAGQGLTRKEIAAEVGLTVDAVRWKMREHKIPARERRGPRPKQPTVPSLEGLREALELVDGAPDPDERDAALQVLVARVRRAVGPNNKS
jgi:hypothetical protein